jgi:hypothetical protein
VLGDICVGGMESGEGVVSVSDRLFRLARSSRTPLPTSLMVKNGWKTFERLSGAIPRPESRTVSMARPAPASEGLRVISTSIGAGPSSASSAFERMFTTTCLNMSGSVRTRSGVAMDVPRPSARRDSACTSLRDLFRLGPRHAAEPELHGQRAQAHVGNVRTSPHSADRATRCRLERGGDDEVPRIIDTPLSGWSFAPSRRVPGC